MTRLPCIHQVAQQIPRRDHARVFAKFVDELIEGKSQSALCQAMSQALYTLGLHSFAYMNIAQRSRAKPMLISTYPEAWTCRYLREGFERHDPVIVRGMSSLDPFDWGMHTLPPETTPQGREVFEEAAHFGIRHGFSVPVPSDADLSILVTFATDERKPSFETCIGEHGAVLQFMAMLFHAHVRRVSTSGRRIGDVMLSSREFECLDWAARGKSAWEISRILNIAPSTAAFHLGNAKRKLGVRSINQAVARFASWR